MVIGGGPIGCELAQVFNRLGMQGYHPPKKCKHFCRGGLPMLLNCWPRCLQRRISSVLLQADILNISDDAGRKRIQVSWDGQKNEILNADAVLVEHRAGLRTLKTWAWITAGVEYDLLKGIKINDYLQTTNPSVYAAGDVCFPYKFTHIADATARIVIQNALFLKSKKYYILDHPLVYLHGA